MVNGGTSKIGGTRMTGTIGITLIPMDLLATAATITDAEHPLVTDLPMDTGIEIIRPMDITEEDTPVASLGMDHQGFTMVWNDQKEDFDIQSSLESALDLEGTPYVGHIFYKIYNQK